MGKPPAYDPVAETEYLVDLGIDVAEQDATIRYLASTYDGASERMYPGTGRPGPRVLDFAPLLQLRDWAINEAIEGLLAAGAAATGGPVEIEGAAVLPPTSAGTARVGLVQVRSMASLGEETVVAEEDLAATGVLIGTHAVMGNGARDDIRDIVYLRPDTFHAGKTRAMVPVVERMNRELMAEGRPYLLIGFGRWGSSDPWLGVPVTWGQVAGAAVLVESTLGDLRIEPSQGSHFFHNLSSLGVVYLSADASAPTPIRWGEIEDMDAVEETEFVRHVRSRRQLSVRVDGRGRRGLVRLEAAAQ
jgi:hypothetical protein